GALALASFASGSSSGSLALLPALAFSLPFSTLTFFWGFGSGSRSSNSVGAVTGRAIAGERSKPAHEMQLGGGTSMCRALARALEESAEEEEEEGGPAPVAT